MIQEVRKSIHFTEYLPDRGRKKDDNPPPTVTVDKKRGRILFSNGTLEALKMQNKFVAFYYASPNIIGWRIRDAVETGTKVGPYAKWRFVKPFGRGAATGKGFWITSIKGILEQFNGRLKSDTYKKVEVKKYIETASILDKGQVTYFIELKEKTDRLGNVVKEEEV